MTGTNLDLPSKFAESPRCSGKWTLIRLMGTPRDYALSPRAYNILARGLGIVAGLLTVLCTFAVGRTGLLDRLVGRFSRSSVRNRLACRGDQRTITAMQQQYILLALAVTVLLMNALGLSFTLMRRSRAQHHDQSDEDRAQARPSAL